MLHQYLPEFLNQVEADVLFKQLLDELPWQSRTIKIFGKEHEIPRQECFLNETNLFYSYSNNESQNFEFPGFLEELRVKMEQECGLCFNSCLANLYRDGRDSNGWHADDESSLGDRPVIASLSLGARRTFKWREQGNKSKKYARELDHGSLFIMKEGFQEKYQHCLPKRLKVHAPRINLTFRNLVDPTV